MFFKVTIVVIYRDVPLATVSESTIWTNYYIDISFDVET